MNYLACQEVRKLDRVDSDKFQWELTGAEILINLDQAKEVWKAADNVCLVVYDNIKGDFRYVMAEWEVMKVELCNTPSK